MSSILILKINITKNTDLLTVVINRIINASYDNQR